METPFHITPARAARFVFLRAIRFDCRHFWLSLHADVWKAGVPIGLWAQKLKIVDQWFLEVLKETLDYWTLQPNSPDANLDPAAMWFYYRYAREGVLVRSFAPVFDDAYLKSIDAPGRGTRFEPVNEFAKRMRESFNVQLKEHNTYLRKIYEADPGLHEHAEWTVLMCAGYAPGEIDQGWQREGLDRDRTDLGGAISMAVYRFKMKINLTSLDLSLWFPKHPNQITLVLNRN